MHETYPLHNYKQNSSIVVFLNVWYTYYLIIKLIASLQTIKIQEVKSVYTPAPFENDKYGSKSSVFGPRNKIRGMNE